MTAAVAATVLGTAGSAVADDEAGRPGFFETYRGHHIMGWGDGEQACAYIDGKRLVVYPAPGGAYTSAVQGFKPEPGLRAITKASVKALGDLGMSAIVEPSPHCPSFASKLPAGTTAVPAGS